MTTRRGFTLVELLVAMFMLVAVGGLIYTLLVRTQQLSRRQAEQSNLQENVRAGALILPAELREIGYSGAADPDLLEIAADRIRFRAMRGVGIVCGITQTVIRVRSPIFGYRAPTVNDDILYFVENTQNMAVDDQWITLGINSIAASTCGADPALAITLDGAGIPGGLLGSVFDGGPVRFFEVMEVGLHVADGRSWLSARSVSANEPTQPVLGPLADGNGLAFRYYNAANNLVAVGGDRNAIRTIEVTLRGRSDERVTVGAGGSTQIATMDLTTRIALRNALRP